MGVFEDLRFEAGTRAVAQAVADCRRRSPSIGGGDSAAAAAAVRGRRPTSTTCRTGGGASLELLEQGDLPGVLCPPGVRVQPGSFSPLVCHRFTARGGTSRRTSVVAAAGAAAARPLNAGRGPRAAADRGRRPRRRRDQF